MDKIRIDVLKIAKYRQTNYNPIGLPPGLSLSTRGDTSSLEKSSSYDAEFHSFSSLDSKSRKRKLEDVHENQEFDSSVSSKVKPAVKIEKDAAQDK